MSNLVARVVENPFYVLELAPDCSWVAIERQGQKLLGMLELGLKPAMIYLTPLGPQARTPTLVRMAMAELQRPERRLYHEFWAKLPVQQNPEISGDSGANSAKSGLAQFVDAFAVHGWSRPDGREMP